MRGPVDPRRAAHQRAAEASQAAVFIALFAVRDARLQLERQPLGQATRRAERCLRVAEGQLVHAMNLLEPRQVARAQWLDSCDAPQPFAGMKPPGL